MSIGSGLRCCLARDPWLNLSQQYIKVFMDSLRTWKCKIKPQRINFKDTQLLEEENDRCKTEETGLRGSPALFGDRYNDLLYTMGLPARTWRVRMLSLENREAFWLQGICILMQHECRSLSLYPPLFISIKIEENRTAILQFSCPESWVDTWKAISSAHFPFLFALFHF